MTDPYRKALDDIASVTDGLDADAVDFACAMIVAAGKIVLHGCGREGLQIRGFAMRLFHLGLNVAMQGDMTTPPLGPGDLFIASAGPGELATVSALMRVAKDAGADVLFLTAVPDCEAAKLADHVLVIPAQTMASDQDGEATSVLPMGSVYEGALFALFEVMVLKLMDRLGIGADEMRARHTNLE